VRRAVVLPRRAASGGSECIDSAVSDGHDEGASPAAQAQTCGYSASTASMSFNDPSQKTDRADSDGNAFCGGEAAVSGPRQRRSASVDATAHDLGNARRCRRQRVGRRGHEPGGRRPPSVPSGGGCPQQSAHPGWPRASARYRRAEHGCPGRKGSRTKNPTHAVPPWRWRKDLRAIRGACAPLCHATRGHRQLPRNSAGREPAAASSPLAAGTAVLRCGPRKVGEQSTGLPGTVGLAVVDKPGRCFAAVTCQTDLACLGGGARPAGPAGPTSPARTASCAAAAASDGRGTRSPHG
jgi:hypothetical protein